MSDLVKALSDKLRARQYKLVTAESCTGGMIAAAITDMAGSSDIFDRGYVTYSNQSKIDSLGVLPETLKQHGAVSEETAIEMAKGALQHSQADVSVSVTGIAGPSGGTDTKPVGLVYIGYTAKGVAPQAKAFNFEGSREEVRTQTVEQALRELISIL